MSIEYVRFTLYKSFVAKLLVLSVRIYRNNSHYLIKYYIKQNICVFHGNAM